MPDLAPTPAPRRARGPGHALGTAGVEPLARTWNQVAVLGKFEGHGSGPFEFTAQTFAEMIANLATQSNGRVPVDYEHVSETQATPALALTGVPAHAWIVGLEVRGQALWGLFEWVDPVTVAQVRGGQYQYFSPAVVWDATDRVTNAPVGAVLTSGALTNHPFLLGMAPLVASTTAASLAPSAVHTPGPIHVAPTTQERPMADPTTPPHDKFAAVMKQLRGLVGLEPDGDEDPMPKLTEMATQHATMAKRLADMEASAADADVADRTQLTAAQRPAARELRLRDPAAFALLFPRPVPDAALSAAERQALLSRVAPPPSTTPGTTPPRTDAARAVTPDDDQAWDASVSDDATALMAAHPARYPDTYDGRSQATHDADHARRTTYLNSLRGT